MSKDIINFIGKSKNFSIKDKKQTIQILLIEDNSGDIRLIEEMLKDSEYHQFNLIYKTNLNDGIKCLIEDEYDVILLDLSLPDSNGINTLSRLLETNCSIPIVILTGLNDQTLAIEAVKIGAQDYLVKGMVNSILLERSIYHAIERHRINEALKYSEIRYKEAFNRAEFFKDIFAHDMNNILQCILSATQLSDLLIKNIIDSAKVEELNDIIQENVKRGARLIKNVRKISQIEQNRRIFKPIDVFNFLIRSVNNLKKEFQNKVIDTQIECFDKNPQIFADNFLKDVFDNILVNAVMHNKNNIVVIHIKISKYNIEGNIYIKIEFIDNAIGIEDSRKNIIFQRGFKLDKSISGMGLGLSLISIIIESYNGKIWVENRIIDNFTKGSNFIILIPAAKIE